MKLAKILWTIASFYILVVGFIYIIVLKDTPSEGSERYQFILENWSLYEYQWKAEFLIAVFLASSSLILANYSKNSGFYLITVGQIVIAVAFPISIGITPNASPELAAIIGKAGHHLVNFGYLISLGGFFTLHWNQKILAVWLRITALVLSTLSFLAFLAFFVDLISSTVAQKAMLLVILLYIINGILGVKINAANIKDL